MKGNSQNLERTKNRKRARSGSSHDLFDRKNDLAIIFPYLAVQSCSRREKIYHTSESSLSRSYIPITLLAKLVHTGREHEDSRPRCIVSGTNPSALVTVLTLRWLRDGESKVGRWGGSKMNRR